VSKPTPTPRPPAHLQPATRKWWRSVQNEYVLQPHHRRLLSLAGEAWDRGQEAREILDREGLTYVDRFGSPRARPEVAVERDSRLSFARLLRELALDVDPPSEARGPLLPANANLRRIS